MRQRRGQMFWPWSRLVAGVGIGEVARLPCLPSLVVPCTMPKHRHTHQLPRAQAQLLAIATDVCRLHAPHLQPRRSSAPTPLLHQPAWAIHLRRRQSTRARKELVRYTSGCGHLWASGSTCGGSWQEARVLPGRHVSAQACGGSWQEARVLTGRSTRAEGCRAWYRQGTQHPTRGGLGFRV